MTSFLIRAFLLLASLAQLVLLVPESTRADLPEPDDVSLRMRAMGSDLAGIVKDDYTDLMKNPACKEDLKKGQVFLEARSFPSYIIRPYPQTSWYISTDELVLGVLPAQVPVACVLRTRLASSRSGYNGYDNATTNKSSSLVLLASHTLGGGLRLGALYRGSGERSDQSSGSGAGSSLRRSSNETGVGCVWGHADPWGGGVSLALRIGDEDEAVEYGYSSMDREDRHEETDWTAVNAGVRVGYAIADGWVLRSVLSAGFADGAVGGSSAWYTNVGDSSLYSSAVLDGDRTVRRFSVASGVEGRFWEEWVFGAAAKLSYSRSSSSVNTLGDSGGVVEDEMKNVSFILPVGIEKMFDFGMALRLGVRAAIEQARSKDVDAEGSVQTDSRSRWEDVTTSYSAGVSYDFSERLRAEMQTDRSLTELQTMTIRVSYLF
jgi:hypothetical protein